MRVSKYISSFLRFRHLRRPNRFFFSENPKTNSKYPGMINEQFDESKKTLRLQKIQELRKPIDPNSLKADRKSPQVTFDCTDPEHPLTQDDAMDTELQHVKKLKKIVEESPKTKSKPKTQSNVVPKTMTIGTQMKHAWEHMKKSLRDVRTDTKIMFRLRMRGRLSTLSLGDYLTYKQIQKDLLKFLPFSLFILIPIGEIFLPFYLYFFPNATPSQFYSEKSVGKMVSDKVKIQRKAYDVLRQRLRLTMSEVFSDLQNEISSILTIESLEEREQKFRELDLKMMMHLISHWDQYKQQLTFSRLTVFEKECVLGFMFKDFISGVNILNRTARIPGLVSSFTRKMVRKIQGVKQPKPDKGPAKPKPDVDFSGTSYLSKSFHGNIKLHFFPFSMLRGMLLNYQIWQHISKIKKQDKILTKDPQKQLESCTKQQIFQLSKNRCSAHLAERDEKEFLIDYWIQPKATDYAQSEDVRLLVEKWGNWEFRFWAMVLRYNYQNYMI